MAQPNLLPSSDAVPKADRSGNGRLKYLDLAHRLLDQIAREGLAPGDRIGTEEEIGERHKASRFTVRHALSMLAQEGYISRRKALGTFVKMVPEHAPRASFVRGTVTVACSNEQASHANEDFAFATVLRAIERTLAEKGFLVQILGLGKDRVNDTGRLNHLLTREDLQGMIAIGPCLEAYRDMLGGLPSVFTGYFYSSVSPLVGDDVRVVCRECIRHLLSHGHRKIAVLCGEGLDPQGFGQFVQGYRDSFESAGLKYQRNALYHAYPGESLVELATEILQSEPRPTAIFAENWRVVDAVLQTCQKLGLSIPRDLSLVGYGQNVVHMSSPVAVTAYVPDSEGIGKRAAGLLIDMLNGIPAPEQQTVLPGKLIERHSVRDMRSEFSS